MYQSNLDLVRLSEVKHKSNKKKSFYLDEIVYNHALSTRIDYSKVILINFIRRPKETLEHLVFFNKIKPLFALRYYQYRLNRIYQISKLTKNSIFLKFENLDDRALSQLSSIIGLNITLKEELIESLKRDFKKDIVPKDILESCEDCYERYHYLITELNSTYETHDY